MCLWKVGHTQSQAERVAEAAGMWLCGTMARSASGNARSRPPQSREWDATLMCTRHETLRKAREVYRVIGADLVVWLEGWAHTVCDLRRGRAFAQLDWI